MRRAYQFALTAGSAALILSGVTMAAPPTTNGFDQWSINNGVISITDTSGPGGCPAGATSCGVPITDNGFFQQQVVVDGVTYFKTIITDLDATGTPIPSAPPGTIPSIPSGALTFSDENYVAQGQSNGIAGKQQLYELNTTTNDEFFTSNNLAVGWAQQSLNEAQVDVSQIVRNEAIGNEFSTAFRFADGDLNITQDVVLTAGTEDKQVFDLRQKAASGSGTVDLDGAGGSDSVGFASGELIKTIWVGQQMADIGVFGFQSFTNLDADLINSRFDNNESGPWEWDAGSTLATEFGAAPVF